MGRVKSRPQPFEYLSELLDRIGDIPPTRIRLNPQPGTATEEDVIRIEAHTDCHCELIDRIVVDKTMGVYEARVGMVLGFYLDTFAHEHELGIVLGTGGLMRLEPGQVRIPDVAFYSWEQFPNRLLPRGQILDRVPDLAVEVLSPSNTKKEMERKRREYFLGGCKLVWEIDPIKRTIRVYTAPDESKLIRERGMLDGGVVLPGFKLPVAELFARAGERASPEDEE